MKVKVIKKEEQEKKRIRPEVMKRLLMDERRQLLSRVREIDKRLQTA